jgi:hypothetical protein
VAGTDDLALMTLTSQRLCAATFEVIVDFCEGAVLVPTSTVRSYTSSLRSQIATRNCQPSKLISMRPNSSHDTS